MDFAAAGLLDGLRGEEREARRRLLEHLSSEGVSLEELQEAVAEDRLVLLPVERRLDGRYTAREIEAETRLPQGMMLRLRRLGGLPEAGPDEPVFGEEDLEMGRATRLFLDAGLREEAITEMTRLLGEAMARIASTTTSTFVDAFLQPGDREDEVAMRFASLGETLTPALAPVFMAAFKAHLRDAVRRGVLGRDDRERGSVAGEQQLAVCFVDVVGFTRLGGELELQELGAVAGRLAELAAEAIVPPVRLVKTIGDAAMFVSPEPAPLVAVALALLDTAAEAELPMLRAGIASGPALMRAGDFYGHSVNLASRVTGIARPGSVLCTQEVHDAATDAFSWSFAGRHRLKGVQDPPAMFRARLPTTAAAADNGARAAQPAAIERARTAETTGARKQPAGRRRKRASS